MSSPTKTYPQFVAKFMINELRGMMNKRKLGLDSYPDPKRFSAILIDCYNGVISRNHMKKAVEELLDAGD